MVSCLSLVGTGAGGAAKGSFSRRNLLSVQSGAPGRGSPARPVPVVSEGKPISPAKAYGVPSPATCLSCALLGGRGSSLLQKLDLSCPEPLDAGPCGRGRGPLPELQWLHGRRSSRVGDEEPRTVPGTQGALPARPGQGSAGQADVSSHRQSRGRSGRGAQAVRPGGRGRGAGRRGRGCAAGKGAFGVRITGQNWGSTPPPKPRPPACPPKSLPGPLHAFPRAPPD